MQPTENYIVSEYPFVKYGSFFSSEMSTSFANFFHTKTIEFSLPTVDDYYDDDYSESLFIDVEYDTRGQPHYHMDDTFLGQDRLILGETFSYVSIFNELLASEYNCFTLEAIALKQ